MSNGEAKAPVNEGGVMKVNPQPSNLFTTFFITHPPIMLHTYHIPVAKFTQAV